MKLAFMSSVCPKMTLEELLAAAASHGYEGLEFRPEWQQAHGIELDASPARRKELAKRIAGSNVEACCLSPGVKFCWPEQQQRDAHLDTLRRYVALAGDVGIGRIRIFADPISNSGGRASSYRRQEEHLAQAAALAEQGGVRLVMETHGNFRAFDAGELLYRIGYPAGLWVNWHLGHCLRHGEDVDEAYRHVKGRVAHVHFNLGEEMAEAEHIERQAMLLRDEGFDGFFSVEVINPEDSQAAMRQHAEGWQKLRAKLGF